MLAHGRTALLAPASAAAVCAQAAEALGAGGFAIYPTETFYGLAVDAGNSEALERLVDLKTRSAHKPIPLIAASAEVVASLAVLPPPLRRLAERFWPGPLTLAVTPRRSVSPWLLSAAGTVGVRVPGHAFARSLAASCRGLVTSTSANLAGAPAPTRISELAPAVREAAALVVDAGTCPGGAPSTVVGLHNGAVVLFRAGAVAASEIAAVLGYEPMPFTQGAS